MYGLLGLKQKGYESTALCLLYLTLTFNFHYVYTFNMDMSSESAGGEYLLQIIKLHPLQEILRAHMVLGCDTAHPVNHSSVIAFQAMQIRWGWGSGFVGEDRENGGLGVRGWE